MIVHGINKKSLPSTLGPSESTLLCKMLDALLTPPVDDLPLLGAAPVPTSDFQTYILVHAILVMTVLV